MTQVDHTRMANAIRGLAMDAVEKAKSGHPGGSLSAVEILVTLYFDVMRHDRWARRTAEKQRH